MALIEPPMRLSREEFDRRVANGAKTFEEIDSEYWKFHQSQMKELKIKWIILIIGAILFISALMFGAVS